MKCPACGDEQRQRRIGRIADLPHTVYHCEACEHLYPAPDELGDEEGGTAGEEE